VFKGKTLSGEAANSRQSPEAHHGRTGLPARLGDDACQNPQNRYFRAMIVTATELANESKSILDRIVLSGEVAEVQRHGKTVAVIQPRVGATRSELLHLLRGRGFSAKDSQELKAAMDITSEVFGYSGGD
jgi:hypothetical protein